MEEINKGDTKMKKNSKFKLLLSVLAICGALFFSSVTVLAASKNVNKWYTTPAKHVYYFDAKGKITKGLKKIGNYYYFFDQNGRQRSGWQKIGNQYYFFRISTGKMAYMYKSTKVNGITLDRYGRAVQTSYAKRKLAVMYKVNLIMQSITKPSDTYRERLLKCFNYIRKTYRCSNIGSFRGYTGDRNWDLYYAERIFISGFSTSDCHSDGVLFAYFTNAVGYPAKAVSSGGHGWAEIGNYVYDVNWSRNYPSYNFFGLHLNTRPTSVIPNYRNNRRYVINI